jgi:hypothetical protein
VKVSGAATAVVDRRKVVGYLLSDTHPHGRHKATFFRRFGFVADEPERLAAALIAHVARHDVTARNDNAFGTRYDVEGELETPDGRRPAIRSVWFVASGETTPKLVTAIPLKRKAR